MSITQAYITSLLVIAVLAVTSNFLLKKNIHDQKGKAVVINISGMQRMLSQKCAFLAHKLVFASKEKRPHIRRLLTEKTNIMEASHHDLIYGKAARKIVPLTSATIHNIYFDAPDNLDQKLKIYFKHLRHLAKISDEELTMDNLDLNSVNYEHVEEILLLLDKVVKEHQFGSDKNIDHLEVLENIVLVAIIIGLLIVGVAILHPMVKKVKKNAVLLRQAKIKAEKESTAKTEFLANVSHELRTPLNAIIGFSEIITQEIFGEIYNIKYKDYVKNINNSAQHLLTIINDILDFATSSTGKLQVDHIELDLNRIAFSVINIIKPISEQAGIKLIVEIPKEQILIMADQKRLKQVLINLLSNAIKFSQSGNKVILKIKKQSVKNLICIQVIDYGIGMNNEDIPKALSSFGQIDGDLGRKYEGVGLGLPLSQKLVKFMNGKFDLQSEIGKGTIVTLTFKAH